ncbi:hypothetical protein ACFX15_032190 [Malus domestica]
MVDAGVNRSPSGYLNNPAEESQGTFMSRTNSITKELQHDSWTTGLNRKVLKVLMTYLPIDQILAESNRRVSSLVPNDDANAKINCASVWNVLKAPDQEQVNRLRPKPFLLDSGEMKEPYDWAGVISEVQFSVSNFCSPQYYLLKILRIGQLISVPSEFTTMAGRRLRDAVKGILTSGDLRGSIKTEVPLNSTFNRGNTVAVTFWSACPRNDLLTEGTFALAEILPKDIKTWVPAYDDDNFCFKLPAKLSPQSYATIKWRIPDSASFGVYRILAILVPQRVYSGPFAISQGSSSASVLPSAGGHAAVRHTL